MYVKNIEISDIDLKDRRFCIGNTEPESKLLDSLKLAGQINPVAVLSTDNSFILVTGWKRVKSLRQLGKKEVAANVNSYSQESVPHHLLTIYFDNKERFTELDKAELVNKFRVLCNYSDEELIKEVLPRIGIKPSPNNLKKYSSVSQLDEEVKKLFHEIYLTFEQLVMLSDLEDEEYRDIVFERVLKKVRLNNNETREILREIYEISQRENVSYEECLDSLLSDSSGGINKNEFRKKVKFRRYPHLSDAESEFQKRAKSVESTGNVKLFHHPYFETNEIEFRVKAKDFSRFSETLKTLSDDDVEKDIKSLFDLVKRGK